MITVNVAAIPSDLMESELFGHEKGAFTGASFRRLGKFEEADKGTIFLDEIAEMDLNMQVKLLRVLQEREIVRIGSNTTVPIDVRVICATHKNLEEEVKAGRFRQDLYFRLFGLPIHLPPLRERQEDIMLLARNFAEEFAKANKAKPFQFSTEAKKKLLSYPFPGNVRELKAMVELACVLADGQEITADDLHFQGLQMESQLLSEEKTLEEYEIEIVRHFLKKYDQDVYLVAKKLNIGKSTIYRMIKSHAMKSN
jgi:DNA-binding NtrC family response regulator